MTSDPDQLRRQIEGTRRELSADVDALTEKVSPSRVVGRRVDRARGAVTNLKDKVMGTTDYATSTMSDTASGFGDRLSSAASSTADTVSSAPTAVRRQAEGNPLAAGLIAFGFGWLVASLVPTTRREQELASQARDVVTERMQPIVQQVASEMADNMREPAQQAVESVKATASDAAATVADESKVAKDHVAGRADEARLTVQDQARS